MYAKLISGKPLTPSLSPSDGERVAAGRVRGLMVSFRKFGLATVLGLARNQHERGARLLREDLPGRFFRLKQRAGPKRRTAGSNGK